MATKRVNTLDLSRMHTEEDFGFMKLVHGETANLPIMEEDNTTETEDDVPEAMSLEATQETAAGASSALDAAIISFEAAYIDFDDALKNATKTPTSAELIEADNKRDDAWTAAYVFIKAQTAHPTAATAKTAREIKATFDKYGNPTKLSRTEETGILHNLLQDLEALTVEQKTATSFAPYITALDDAEEDYLDLLAIRTSEKAKLITGRVKAARQECDTAYRAMISTVNALITINGVTPYETFTNNMNVHISRQKTVLKARETKAGTQAGTTTPPQDDAPVMDEE